MVAGERDLLAREETLDDPNRLAEPLDANRVGIEAQPDLLVLGLHVAGSEADLDSPVGEQVERRRLPRDERGVAQVVVQDEGPDAHRRGRLGRDGQCDPRREDVREVVGDEEHRVAESLGTACLLTPLGSALGPAGADPEAEEPRH